MNDKNNRSIALRLSAIRSAVAAVALAVLAFLFVFGGNDEIGLLFVLASVILLVHSFVPTVMHSFDDQ